MQRTCAQCGAPFSAVDDRHRFCSKACGRRVYGPDSPDRTCDSPECGRPVRAKGLCSMHWKRAFARPEEYRITCEWCGVEHVTPRRNGRFCSRECIGAARAEAARMRKLPVHVGPAPLRPVPSPAPMSEPRRSDWWKFLVSGACKRCGAAFLAPAATLEPGQLPSYCSSRCQRRMGRLRRRVRVRVVRTEPYTLAEIAVRDGLVCRLCGKRAAMDRVVPHPLAPTIDHVVPLSAGGDDTRVNVQLAHFLCNARKGDRGSQQLALFG